MYYKAAAADFVSFVNIAKCTNSNHHLCAILKYKASKKERLLASLQISKLLYLVVDRSQVVNIGYNI